MATPEEMRITVTANGPYRVAGSVPLVSRTIVTDEEGFSVEWGEGDAFTTDAEYELCRCGATKTAPFCDRACDDGGFDGTETASREPYLAQADEEVGPNLILTDAEVLCSFARFCDFGGRVWNLVEEPDEASREVAIRDAKLCPSGRLIAWDRETQRPFEEDYEPSIGVVQDPTQGCSGPLAVRGASRWRRPTASRTNSGTGRPSVGAANRTTSRSATGPMPRSASTTGIADPTKKVA